MGNESYQFGMDNEGSRVVIHVVLDGKERLWIFNSCLFLCCIAAVQFFKKCIVDDPGMSTAVAAIQTLLEFMNQNSGNSLSLFTKRERAMRSSACLLGYVCLHLVYKQ